MYVVLEGQIDIQTQGRSIYTAGPGELAGEMAMIDAQGPYGAGIILSNKRSASIRPRPLRTIMPSTGIESTTGFERSMALPSSLANSSSRPMRRCGRSWRM
jgi:CRP-like cAMP-binding protein